MKTILLISSIWLFFIESLASDEILSKIEKNFKRVTNISGDFIQTKKIAFLNNPIISRGYFVLDKPSSLRWELKSPIRSILILIDDRIFQWNEARELVKEIDLKKDPMNQAVFQQLLLWFNGEFKDLTEIYAIKQISDTTIRLIPKSEEYKKILNSIEVSFTNKLEYISSIKLIEPNNDYTFIEFKNPMINKKLTSKAFSIK